MKQEELMFLLPKHARKAQHVPSGRASNRLIQLVAI